MAPNVCITEYDAILDEINAEAEAALFGDDPDALRCIVGQLAKFATRLAELLADVEDERDWRQDHPWRTVLDEVHGLLTHPTRPLTVARWYRR